MWPKTTEEILAQKELTVVATNVFQFRSLGIPSLSRMAETAIYVPFGNLLQELEILANGKTAFSGRSVEIDWMRNLLHPDKFVVLDEKYLMSHKVLYVSKKWLYWKRFLKLSQRMLETGFDRVDDNPGFMVPLVIRATNPKIFYRILETQSHPNITFDDCKDCFFLLFIGYVFAFVSTIVKKQFFN